MLELLLLLQDTAAAVADTVADVIVSPGTEYATEGVGVLLASASGIVGSFLLGLAKVGLAKVKVLDTLIWKVVQPFQPVILMGLGVLLPLLVNALGLIAPLPDGALIASAPLAALIGITTRELAVRVAPQLKG
jgi:hypothetical protein